MDIISQFEFKAENIWWINYYRARNIMKIFWYDKWERFEWAINRTTSKIKDEKVMNDNFFPVEIKTKWRPWRDYLLTKWACYLLVQNCDDRKQEVQILKKYLWDVYLNQKIKKDLFLEYENKRSYKFLKNIVPLFLLIIILVLTFSFYFDFFKENTNSNNQNDIINYVKNKANEIKDNNFLNEKEAPENAFTWNIISDEEIFIPEVSFQQELNEYINSWWNNNYKDIENLNSRNDFTLSLTWENLVKSYFVLWNNDFFRDSCSLLSQKYCNSWSKNLSSFNSVWEKTKSWYEVLNVEEKEKWIYCVKIKYKLKDDLSDNYIEETYNYQTSTYNWIEYISWRFCEKIKKWEKNIPCPFKLNNYYCN